MVQIASSYASTLAKYSPDNQTAFAQTSAYVPPPAPQQWIEANSDKKFYLEKSGENSYKLGSVSGSASKIPANTVAVDLNVAYAIDSKELSLVDWAMARIGDEIRRENALQAFGSALSFAPEADLSFDSSSMNQADLMQLLKRLGQASSDLKTATSLGNASDRQSNAAALGLSASLLGAAMEQQRLFEEEAATLSTSSEAAAVSNAQDRLSDANTALRDASTRLTSATATLTGFQTTLNEASELLEAAQAPESGASDEDLAALQEAYNTAETDYDSALGDVATEQTNFDNTETDVATAQSAVDQASANLAAADNFNEVMSAAYAQLVAGLTSEMEAAQLAYSQTATSTATSTQLNALTSAAGGALNSRLKSAADLALLTNPAVALFSALDVQQTDDGYVINTSGMGARDTQKAVVRAALEEALSDPALQTALADAMAANADSLGTADMDLPSQTQLYNEVAAAVISSMLANDAYLDELASGAVDFGTQLSQMLGNELVSASQRDNALMSSMN